MKNDIGTCPRGRFYSLALAIPDATVSDCDDDDYMGRILASGY